MITVRDNTKGNKIVASKFYHQMLLPNTIIEIQKSFGTSNVKSIVINKKTITQDM